MNRGFSLGKVCVMKKASIVAVPACSEGNAPKTMGDAVKLDVYKSMPSSLSMAARPAGDPCME